MWLSISVYDSRTMTMSSVINHIFRYDQSATWARGVIPLTGLSFLRISPPCCPTIPPIHALNLILGLTLIVATKATTMTTHGITTYYYSNLFEIININIMDIYIFNFFNFNFKILNYLISSMNLKWNNL